MARSFDGNISNFLTYAGAIVTSAPLTMACFFNAADTTNLHSLMSISASGSENWFLLAAAGNQAGDPIIADVAAAGAETFSTTSTGYTANAYHHAAAVFTSATSRTSYLNGAGAGTDTTNATPGGTLNRTDIGLIRALGGSYNAATASIASAAIWNAALNSSEVAQHTSGILPVFIRPASLVAYWNLFGDESPEPSQVGNFPLTITGTVPKSAHPTNLIYPSRAMNRYRGLRVA